MFLYITETSNLLKDGEGVGTSTVGTYTVEEAIDFIGFGRFQLNLVLVTGLFAVSGGCCWLAVSDCLL